MGRSLDERIAELQKRKQQQDERAALQKTITEAKAKLQKMRKKK